MNHTAAGLLVPLILASASVARDYCVAPDGNDTNAGTIEKPFATLEKARDAIRQSKARVLGPGRITVYLRHGKYFRTQPFTLAEPRIRASPASRSPGGPIPAKKSASSAACRSQPAWFAPVASSDPEFCPSRPGGPGPVPQGRPGR